MNVETAVMPNFLVIGVVKGGTTSLHHYLSQHPDVYLTPIKETNHFAASDMQHEHFSHEYALDVSIDLQRYFKGGMKELVHIAHVDDPTDYQQLYSQVCGERAIGEISNSYAVCPGAAPAIKAAVPDAKLVIMLRNPITRIWSQYLMNLREGKTANNDFLEEIITDQNQKVRGWGASHLYHELGLYHSQLQHYLKHFSKDQIKVILYEEYRAQPERILKDLFQFLEVTPDVPINTSKQMNTAAMPRFKKLNNLMVQTGVMKSAKNLLGRKARQQLKGLLYSSKNIPKMDAASRAYLIDFYHSEVEQLSNFLERDMLFYWNFKTETA